MSVYRHSKSGVFLMEIILAILFFSVAGAVCVQMFAKAYLLGEASGSQTMAVSHGQSVAECFKATNGSLQEMQALLGGELAGNTLTLWYAHDWSTAEQPQADGFTLIVAQTAPTLPALQEAELSIHSPRQPQPLLKLPLASYDNG